MIELHSYRTGIQGTSLALSRVEGAPHKCTPIPGVHQSLKHDGKNLAVLPRLSSHVMPNLEPYLSVNFLETRS